MTNQSLTLECFRSIHQIDQQIWDSLNGPNDTFHSHAFISAMEEANSEEVDSWYLVFTANLQPVATAVLSIFTVSLDLMVDDATLKQLIKGIRQLIPGFLDVDILFCGLPVSLGQRNLVVCPVEFTEQVLDLLVSKMESIAAEKKISLLCLKEFREDETGQLTPLRKSGFLKAHSLPYVWMKIRWSDFESYLQSLRHGYRRMVRQTLKRNGSGIPRIERAGNHTGPSNGTRLVLGGTDICSPETFHKLYLEVMGRATVTLETLDLKFFEQIFSTMDDKLEILVYVQDDRVLGAALLATDELKMTFMLVGMDYAELREHETYFHLVYGILKLAIDRQVRELNLGQTSYWVKQRIGGSIDPMYIYVKSRNTFVHALLRTFQNSLFPETTLVSPRVFKPDSGQHLQ